MCGNAREGGARIRFAGSLTPQASSKFSGQFCPGWPRVRRCVSSLEELFRNNLSLCMPGHLPAGHRPTVRDPIPAGGTHRHLQQLRPFVGHCARVVRLAHQSHLCRHLQALLPKCGLHAPRCIQVVHLDPATLKQLHRCGRVSHFSTYSRHT